MAALEKKTDNRRSNAAAAGSPLPLRAVVPIHPEELSLCRACQGRCAPLRGGDGAARLDRHKDANDSGMDRDNGKTDNGNRNGGGALGRAVARPHWCPWCPKVSTGH